MTLQSAPSSFALAGCLALGTLALAALPAAAQEESLRFETVVGFAPGKRVDLGARVGPVRVTWLTLEDLGQGGGSIAARLRGGASDTQTMLRASFDCENPKGEEWEVTYTIELLDRKGKLIDRGTRKESFEGEADTVKLDHPILSYVVPMIDRVRIKLEARLD